MSWTGAIADAECAAFWESSSLTERPDTLNRIKVTGVEVPWQTLPALLDGVAATASGQSGIEIDGRFLTYREIASLARCVAANLQTRGLNAGDRVCSLMGNRHEVLLTWFGVVMAGGVWVPINTGLIGQDLAYTIEDAAPTLLIVDAEHLDRVSDPVLARALPVGRYLIGGPPPAGWQPFERLLDSNPVHRPIELQPSDPAAIIYTGGTTGLPKGVVLPHFAMICGGMRYGEAMQAGPADRHFSVSPLFHAGGLTISVLGPMMAGMCSTIDRNFSLSNYWQRVRESRATIINPIGVILTLLCRQEPKASDRSHSVRVCLGVTGQLPEGIPAEFSRRFGIEVVNIYALTEASGAMIVYNTIGSPKPESNGCRSHWVDIGIVDPLGQQLAPHQMGEIVLRPKLPCTFMLGYHNNESGTLRVLRDLWLHTGDLGFLDEDGYLYFRGREAHWLRRRGENISAYELESIISQYPGLKELAVVGVPSEIGEEEVKLFVVPESATAFDPAELVLWCGERMATFKVPRFIELLPALPRSTAKREVERHVLRGMKNDGAWDREKVFGRRMPSRQRAARQ